MRWNEIRRTVEARLRLEAAHWVAEQKNEILPKLLKEFERVHRQTKTLPEFADLVDWNARDTELQELRGLPRP